MKKIISINNPKQRTYGHLLNMVNISSEKLISLLGKPERVESSKTDWEWTLEFEGGSILYIYDWKCGKNYNGESGLDLDEIMVWHIGGTNKDKEICDMLIGFLYQEEWPCHDDIRRKMILDNTALSH